MLYKEMKVICLFSQEHCPSYLLYNVMNTPIYTVLNILLYTVFYSMLFKNVKVPLRTSLFIANICVHYRLQYSVQYGRNANTYKRANNICVKKILSLVKSLQNFTLFCRESEQVCNFAFFVWHFLQYFETLCYVFALFGPFGPFTLFCCNLDLS